MRNSKSRLKAPSSSQIYSISVRKRKLLAGESSTGRPFTTYEVVCAHIWQRVTIAREVADKEKSRLFIGIDIRGRFASYPQYYFGNGAIFTSAIAPVAELKKERLSHTANLVQKAIADFKEDKVQAVLGFLSDKSKDYHCLRFNSVTDMVVRSSPRLRMYETDFGWGRPIAVTFDIKLNHDGAILKYHF
ncbi:hypothetical protein O6H91_14G024300 [Diphasiastrum complanatum]|uniref:Uncharacterized protein n=1 Tax=Diphasiastrum complanatum TaxID=34168 RepID=A0ACC2BMA9_DIPCM|nr:hypothetical protein O6H91_14G024300 [Diphasiastrum complanatum]